LGKYYSALYSHSLLLPFAFNRAVIIIKILRLGALSFGPAHWCFIVIFGCLLLGHNTLPPIKTPQNPLQSPRSPPFTTTNQSPPIKNE